MAKKQPKYKTIRTSPTISRTSYDVYDMYGIPISNFLERSAMALVLDPQKAKEETWPEIKAKQLENKAYKEIIRFFETKILKNNERISELMEGIEESIREKTSNDIQKALKELYTRVRVEREKREKAEADGIRYTPKRISLDAVFEVCTQNDIVPKMVLPKVEPVVLKDYFDEECARYI